MENLGQTYLRGQIWFAEVPYDYKKEDRDYSVKRPVLIISNNIINRDSNKILIAPLTQFRFKESEFHLECSYNRSRSIVLIDNQKTVLKRDFDSYQFTMSEEFMEKVDEALMKVIGMKEMNLSYIPKDNILKDSDEEPDTVAPEKETAVEPLEDDLDEFYSMSRASSETKRKYWTKDKKIEFVCDYELMIRDDKPGDFIRIKWELDKSEDIKRLYSKFMEALG